jgi:hypothetical protein
MEMEELEMKVAKSIDYTYVKFQNGYHIIRRNKGDDFECVRELKFVEVETGLVYHYDRNGGKQLTRDSQRRVSKLVAI